MSKKVVSVSLPLRGFATIDNQLRTVVVRLQHGPMECANLFELGWFMCVLDVSYTSQTTPARLKRMIESARLEPYPWANDRTPW